MRALVLLAALSAAGAGCDRRGRAVQIVEAPPGDVAATVRAEAGAAEMEQRRLLVYVTASWCGPCRRFHDAVSAGRLDGRLPGLRLIAFDLDRDDAALKRAGYRSRSIPLFARPGPDGRASGRAVEGVGDGPRAIDELAAELERLLE